MIIDTILGIAKELFGFRDRLRQAKSERRDKIAAFFENVSRCVADVSTSLKDGEVPHGKCAEMQLYAEELPGLVEDELGAAQAAQLGSDLGSAYEVERLLGDLPDGPARDAELAKLDEAAGVFQGLANVVRAR